MSLSYYTLLSPRTARAMGNCSKSGGRGGGTVVSLSPSKRQLDGYSRCGVTFLLVTSEAAIEKTARRHSFDNKTSESFVGWICTLSYALG